ncbi:MAG: MATE family efflux transporter [Marinibacterium sp.]|nr:MATE family efflux transporter [Marinibacterium sp.]
MSYSGHVRAILVLGLPLIGGHLAQFAIGLTDSIMLGWYSVEALASVTLAGSYFFTLFLLGSGFAGAVMPMVAALAAEDDQTGIRRVTRMGLWLSVLYAACAMPLLIWSEPVLRALGQTPEVAGLAAEYLQVAGWGLFPAVAVMVMKSYLAALERTQIVFWITIIAAAVNVLTNYMLIFGNWGAPELGILGAAVASIVTQTASLIGVIIYAVRVLPEHALFQRMWRPDWEAFFRVFRLGMPIGLTMLSESSLFAASSVMMGWLGTVALAAHGAAISLAGLTFMVHLGLSNAATVRAGNAFGRRDRAHMARGAVAVIGLSLAMALLASAVFLLVPEPLIRLFLDASKRGDPDYAAIVAMGSSLLAVAALFQLMDGVQVIALGLLRGVQDTAQPMLMAALSYWGVGMPLGYGLGFGLGLGATGIWLGLVGGLLTAAALLMARFWRRSIQSVPYVQAGA